jgi:hypothetical protein
MKPVLFCSFLLAFAVFSCKPKPLDNLKDVAKQAEENKVFRVPREKLASETQRVADSVLTLVLADQKHVQTSKPSDSLCDLSQTKPYREFQQKYNGRAQPVTDIALLNDLQAEMQNLRKYRNELSEPEGNFPATFQTLNDSLLYVRPIKAGEGICGNTNTPSGFWVFRFPKQKFVEILTIKVKPKPAKGPNW